MGDQEEQPSDAGQEDPGEANAHDSNQDGMEEDRPVEALNHPGPRGSRKVNHHGAGEERREEEEDRGSGDIVRELMLLGVGRDEAMAHAQYLRDDAARVAEAGGGIQAVERLAVAEVFSPPRVTAAAIRYPELGVAPGMAIGLTPTDSDGTPWDLSKSEHRRRARQRLSDEKTALPYRKSRVQRVQRDDGNESARQ